MVLSQNTILIFVVFFDWLCVTVCGSGQSSRAWCHGELYQPDRRRAGAWRSRGEQRSVRTRVAQSQMA
jgi:hypothetical protein